MSKVNWCLRSICAGFALCLWLSSVVHAQPGRLHTENKKAIKSYRKALESLKDAMLPGADKEKIEQEVEEALIKAIGWDSNFSEAERMLAGLRFEQGNFAEAQDRYQRFLLRDGASWIRDHFAWAEASRFLLNPEGMNSAMTRMQRIPGVLQGPDTSRIQRVLQDAEFMRYALDHPIQVNPIALPASISTDQDEYFPSLWLAGDGLVFTRRIADLRQPNGQEDLYVARQREGQWQEASPLRGLNTPNNEGAATLSGDGSMLCFTMCRDADRPGEGSHRGSCDLYVSRRDAKGQWNKPVNMGAVNTGGWESQPSLSPDGRVLYFTRGRGRPGRRQHDIYSARVLPNGTFSKPERLSDAVNTTGQEMRPFLHPDGRHLYFASDGHPGMGGMDLFVTELEADGEWGTPVNLGYPLNTPADESGIVVASDGRTGYFSRDVEEQLDLHEFILPEAIAADPTSALEGIIRSEGGDMLPAAEIRLLNSKTGTPFAEGSVGADARYHIPVPAQRDFVLLVEAPDHLFKSVRIESGGIQGREIRDFELSPLKEGAEVVLRNVFFESGSSDVASDSEPELIEVAGWLRSNPHVRLEVEGHTDDVGSAQDNLSLSAQRAQAVMAFLLAEGAGSAQLTAVGYGQSRPAVEAQTEEARRQNRRTSLRVVGVD